MNRIGLPATGQQDNLSNCHDMYVFEARLRDSHVWMPCPFAAEPADKAANTVAAMNRTDPSFYYRSVLVAT